MSADPARSLRSGWPWAVAVIAVAALAVAAWFAGEWMGGSVVTSSTHEAVVTQSA